MRSTLPAPPRGGGGGGGGEAAAGGVASGHGGGGHWGGGGGRLGDSNLSIFLGLEERASREMKLQDDFRGKMIPEQGKAA